MKFNLLLLSLLLSIHCLGQDYSYQSDRAFRSPNEFIGYTFVPYKMENPKQGIKSRLGTDDVSFRISRSYLYVNGGQFEGAYNINTINPTEYGFKILHMNARDATIQGHMKVILNRIKQVEALIFRRSQKDPEIIYHIMEIPQDVKQTEKEYFTDINELKLESTSELWGKTVRPFFLNLQKTQNRLREDDDLSISFEEKVTVIDKTKKKKQKKPKKKKKKKGEEESEEGLEEEVMEEVEEVVELVIDTSTIDTAQTDPRKLKIVKEYFCHLRFIQTDDDGDEKEIKKVYRIEKWKERKDEAAKMDEEKYQIEFKSKDVPGGVFYIYLTGHRTISSMEFGGDTYKMRGF